MLTKKPTGFLFSYNGFHHHWNAHQPQASTSPYPPLGTRTTSEEQPSLGQRRTYANFRSSHHNNEYDDLAWPDLKHPHPHPTPYEIFRQKKGAPYSKRRFYELVKIYHPDRHTHSETLCGGLSYAVKLERYRLIIAANDILSDPAKRSAYDRFGAGWNGQPHIGESRHGPDWGNPGRRNWDPRRDYNSSDSPFHNATWEDWERWYERDSKGPARPVYVSHSTFVSLIAMLAALGGVFQATRVSNYSSSIEERIDKVHRECSQFLNARKMEADALAGDREGRVQKFLQKRSLNEAGAVEDEIVSDQLAGPDVCSSGALGNRSMAMFRERND